ncbi:MAG: EcsC family protein [Bacteroidota bacterium]|nr:EcsC family protein [Bacteroidota bacterium]MDE2835330.1 EcsC family protein [Bacteroidota bacterium]MDE2956685.1 EcsC family protein [Bacteroidota bacterium]
MRLNSYEKSARREVDAWLRGDGSVLAQAMDWLMRPVDWVVEQGVPETVVDQMNEAVDVFLSRLNDAGKWAVDLEGILNEAQKRQMEVSQVEDLRNQALEDLDPMAQGLFSRNVMLAALSGGGTGLGGGVFIAADIPLLFVINLHLIQRIGAAYGFPMTSPEYSPIVLAIYNAAAANSREARANAVREISILAAALAGGMSSYRGRVRGTIANQSRHLPREIAKNLVGRKLLQAVPLAGAAVGAGVNFWFTRETARTSYMLFRSMYLEYKERL